MQRRLIAARRAFRVIAVLFLCFSGCSVSDFECCLMYFKVMLYTTFVTEKTPECRLTECYSEYCVVSVVFRLFCKYF